MRISDWSSDVCSSDLFKHDKIARTINCGGHFAAGQQGEAHEQSDTWTFRGAAGRRDDLWRLYGPGAGPHRRRGLVELPGGDRKSVVEGKSVSVRVDLG